MTTQHTAGEEQAPLTRQGGEGAADALLPAGTRARPAKRQTAAGRELPKPRVGPV